jgi:hypothetical protein
MFANVASGRIWHDVADTYLGIAYPDSRLLIGVGNQRPKNEQGVERCREHIHSDLSHHSVSLIA